MDISKLSYEEALSRLEDLLKELENEDCLLDDSINKFKEGMLLYNHCNNLLKKAEGEVKIILDEGKNTFADFDTVREVEDEYYWRTGVLL